MAEGVDVVDRPVAFLAEAFHEMGVEQLVEDLKGQEPILVASLPQDDLDLLVGGVVHVVASREEREDGQGDLGVLPDSKIYVE